MEYSFDDLCRDLQIGYEIEFTYTGRKSSISNTHSGWVLSEFHKEDHFVYGTAQELLQYGIIDGIPLKVIWPMVDVETVF